MPSLKIKFDWSILDGKLSFDTGRLVIYGGYAFHTNNPSMDHNDCIAALASTMRMDRASLIGKAHRFYWRPIEQDAVQVSPVRKIDEDWAYANKDEFVEIVNRRLATRPRRTESKLFERALLEHEDDTDERAGVIIRKKGTNLVLACRGWGKKKAADGGYSPNTLDIAKGHATKGESLAQAAVREAKEETGLSLRGVRHIGTFDYGRKNKTLAVFYAEKDFELEDLFCESTFTNVYGKVVPEMVDYYLVEIGDLDPWFKSLKPILKTCFEKIIRR